MALAKDGDGRISGDELGVVLKALGRKPPGRPRDVHEVKFFARGVRGLLRTAEELKAMVGEADEAAAALLHAACCNALA